MKVELISYTDDAVNLLLFTKNTRLMDDDNAYEKVSKWPWDKKQDELDYMLKTIKSSWEFIDYTFNVREVTREILGEKSLQSKTHAPGRGVCP